MIIFRRFAIKKFVFAWQFVKEIRMHLTSLTKLLNKKILNVFEQFFAARPIILKCPLIPSF